MLLRLSDDVPLVMLSATPPVSSGETCSSSSLSYVLVLLSCFTFSGLTKHEGPALLWEL